MRERVAVLRLLTSAGTRLIESASSRRRLLEAAARTVETLPAILLPDLLSDMKRVFFLRIPLNYTDTYRRRSAYLFHVAAALEGKPLSEICTYLSYDTIADVSQQKHLEHFSDHVLDDYEENAEEAD